MTGSAHPSIILPVAHTAAIGAISDDSISFARQLADELGIAAEFVRCNIMELPRCVSSSFDIVYTSYGMLSWISDLTRWAEVAAGCMQPGAVFYMVEHHPIGRVLFPRRYDDAENPLDVRSFGTRAAVNVEEWGSYANTQVSEYQTAYYWRHTLGDVVSAPAVAGLRIEYLHKFPAVGAQLFHDNPLALDPDSVPYFFSVRASAPSRPESATGCE